MPVFSYVFFPIDKLPALFFILLVIGIFVVLKRAYKVLYVIKLSNHNQRHFSTDDEMLQLMKWINVNADHRLDSITANLVASSQILLHTKVKITIHPHAESSEMRARYRNYYAIYAKVSDYTVYKEIKKLNTTYLVISNCNAHCTSTTTLSDVVKFSDLKKKWSENLKPFCLRVLEGSWDSAFFKYSWASSKFSYVVLKIV